MLACCGLVWKLLGLFACCGRGAWCRLDGNGGAFMLSVGVRTCSVDSVDVVGDCELVTGVRELLGACW